MSKGVFRNASKIVRSHTYIKDIVYPYKDFEVFPSVRQIALVRYGALATFQSRRFT